MKVNLRSRRVAISELIGSLLAIAVTLIAGAAAWGYVNMQAGVTEIQYGQNAQGVMAALQETYVPFNMNFTNPAKVSVWFYNTGPQTFYPVQITIYNGTKSLNVMWNSTKVVNLNNPNCNPSASGYESRPLYNPTAKSQPSNVFGVGTGGISYITLTLPCSLAWRPAGTSYFLLVTGRYGNSVTFSQFG